MEEYEYGIIGAGPIGIELAVELKKREANYVHFEAGQIGATIEWYAPGTTFFSSPDRIAIAGVPLANTLQGKANREEYLNYLRLVVEQFALEIKSYTKVETIAKTESGFELSYKGAQASDESSCRVKKLILAIGDMHSPRMLDIPGEDLPHVSHYLEEPHKYFAKKVLIVGGKNSAVEAAIRLVRVGAEVSMSYRGKEFDSKRIKYWLYPELIHLIREKKITFLKNSKPTKVESNTVTIQTDGETESKVDADFVLLLTGYVQNIDLFEQLKLKLEGDEQKPVLNEENMEASVQGVYVIGTAMAGTQLHGVTEYIETSHAHVAKLVKEFFGEEREYRQADPSFLEN